MAANEPRSSAQYHARTRHDGMANTDMMSKPLCLAVQLDLSICSQAGDCRHEWLAGKSRDDVESRPVASEPWPRKERVPDDMSPRPNNDPKLVNGSPSRREPPISHCLVLRKKHRQDLVRELAMQEPVTRRQPGWCFGHGENGTSTS